MEISLSEFIAESFNHPLREKILAGCGFRVRAGEIDLEFTGQQAGSQWRFDCASVPGLRAITVINQVESVVVLKTVLENGGTAVVTDINAIEPLYLAFAQQDRAWRHLYAEGGYADSYYPPRAFRNCEFSFGTTDLSLCSNSGARSSLQYLPLLISLQDQSETSAGLFCGMEWSGHWYLRFGKLEAHSTRLCFGVGVAGLSLEPGERLVLPAVHLGFFTGGETAGSNSLRRYLREHVCPPINGKPVIPKVSYDHWFGIGPEINENVLKIQADRAANLGVETFVVDAGWFGGFPEDVGTWTSHREKLPNGLKPVAEHVRSLGMEFGLWFELERAEAGTQARLEHPELFIPSPPGYDAKAEGQILYDGSGSALLNLALPEAREWAIESVSRLICELDLKWSRWDFNLSPAAYWNAIDATGKFQFVWMEGLYEVLDTLIERHPDWMIESCASGGRRIDLGTLRRSHALWISDHSVTASVCRYMQARANRFLPSHLLNSSIAVRADQDHDEFDDAAILSRMLGKMSLDGAVACWSETLVERTSKLVKVFKKIRHLFAGDFYPLLSQPQSAVDHDAVMFVARDCDEAALFVFAGSRGAAGMVLQLQGLNADAHYRVSAVLAVEGSVFKGADLHEKGMEIELSPNGAELYLLELVAD